MRRLVRLFCLLALCTACVPVGGAMADPYPVTNTNDSGPGSLRAAILAANGRAGEDTIPIAATGTINLETPLQVIFDNVSIIGPGVGLLTVRRSSGDDFRVLHFSSDASSVSGLTIANGRSELGAGILNTFGSLVLDDVVVKGSEAIVEGDTKATAEGGGIYSEGPLTLRESVVAGNVARASDGSSETWAFGGGVVAQEALTVEASTISGNVSEATGGGTMAVAQGGGLVAGVGVTIERSTISGNTVKAAGAASQVRSQGGGIQMHAGALTGSTISGNSAISADEARSANLHAGGLGSDSILARGTIVANPLGDADSCDVGGLDTIVSGGFNLDEDGSCEFGEGSDLAGVIAGLGPLAENGGPTPTHALLDGSIAIDRGNSFGAATDQRGLPRPVDFAAISNKEGGDGSDIGAFEVQAPAPGAAPVLVQAVRGDRQAPNTRIVFAPPRVTFKRFAKFRFASTEAQSRFQCKIDKGRWRGCRNPFKRKVSAGEGTGRKHLFKVRAIDRFGNVDRTPAQFGWRVKKLGG
jgi:hypothetical protein